MFCLYSSVHTYVLFYLDCIPALYLPLLQYLNHHHPSYPKGILPPSFSPLSFPFQTHSNPYSLAVSPTITQPPSFYLLRTQFPITTLSLSLPSQPIPPLHIISILQFTITILHFLSFPFPITFPYSHFLSFLHCSITTLLLSSPCQHNSAS